MVNGVSLLQIMLFVDLVSPLLPTIIEPTNHSTLSTDLPQCWYLSATMHGDNNRTEAYKIGKDTIIHVVHKCTVNRLYGLCFFVNYL